MIIQNWNFEIFFETKDSMAEPTCELIHLWREAKLPVKVIRYDNAGESKVLQQRLRSKDWKINTKFQYRSRATPQ